MKCMNVKVLAFGIAKDIFGTTELNVEMKEGATVNDLTTSLKTTFPALEKLKTFLVAQENRYANNNDFLIEGKEIAIIPPVSGG
jgi:molybdopterin converting factor small subunit